MTTQNNTGFITLGELCGRSHNASPDQDTFLTNNRKAHRDEVVTPASPAPNKTI